MTTNHIKSKLCFYDERNPDYVDGKPADPCYCDNCFAGRTELALEVLRLKKKLNRRTIQ